MVFRHGKKLNIRGCFADHVQKARDPFRMAQHLGGAGDDAQVRLSLCHQAHQPAGGAPSFIIIAAHIGQAAASLDIRVGGDHRDALLLQPVNLFNNKGIVVRCNDQTVDAQIHQLVYGGKLGSRVKNDPPDQHRAVIGGQLLRFPGDPLQHLLEKRVFRTEENHADPQLFFLGGQRHAGPVGFVAQSPGNLTHLLGGLRIDGAPVVQHPVYRSPGDIGQVGNLFHGHHMGYPPFTLPVAP